MNLSMIVSRMICINKKSTQNYRQIKTVDGVLLKINLNTVIKNLQARIFPFIIALSALSVSASAAFYSVSGLSKLFAGAAFAVIIMAASLEVAKLVIASLLYQYREKLPRLLKYYLSVACLILILITSMGIYGFLSAAYQETAALAGNIDAQISLVETKRDNVKEQLAIYNAEKETINEAVSSLRSGLSNNVIQYTDTLGNVITTTSSSTRRALERQLDQAIERQTEINSRVDQLNQQLFEYETEVVEITSNANIAGELGPLKYLSGLTGKPMDQIINWLLLVIIFVFDPLAIALVIAANFAFEQLKNKVMTDEEMKKKYAQLAYQDQLLRDEEEFDEEHALDMVLNDMVKTVEDEEWDEERIDIIGQNGNDGIHYEQESELSTDVKQKLELLDHPRIKEAIKHAKRAGEL